MLGDSTNATANMLARIMVDTRLAVEQRKLEVPLAGVHALASIQGRTNDLSSWIRSEEKVSLIAQVKRTSPDMETPIEHYDPVMLASRFATSGARALTVATNEKYYRGGIADLTLVSQEVHIPVIRQDFVYDEYQIIEARAAGADGVLLISSLLEAEHLRALISIAQRNRMTALVQVQSRDEVLEAIAFEPRVIAISNRDMQDFTVDLDRTLRLRELIPAHMTVISMGGLRTAEDVAYVHQAGIDAIVVGQALLTVPDTAKAISELFKLTQ
jgi:indole-3-glycerol phosphate synthase